MEKFRSCVICSKQGNVMLYAGLPHEEVGIVSVSKFCRVVVALKTLAPNQQIMIVEISGAKAAVLENPCFLVCILTSQTSLVEKYELVFDALQIAHLFDLFYSEEIGLIVHREKAVVSAAADSYSVNTEIHFSEHSEELNLPQQRKFFADFASNYVDKLLLREPLCSEWILPLLSADGVVGCSLVSGDGNEVLNLPAHFGPDVGHFGYHDLLLCCATVQSVIEQAMEVMRIMNETEAESKDTTAKARPCHTGTFRLEGQLRTVRVLNLGTHGHNSYHALLLPTSNGPMSLANQCAGLCLIVYYWFNTAAFQYAEGPLASYTHSSGEYLPMHDTIDDSASSSRKATDRGDGSVIGKDQEWNGPPTGMKEHAFRVACAALECIAAAFPSRDALPPLLTARATPPPDAKPSSARPLPFSCPCPDQAHGVPHRPAPKPAPPPKPRPSVAPSKARRNQVRARDMRLHPTGGRNADLDERGCSAGEGAAAWGAVREARVGAVHEAPLRLADPIDARQSGRCGGAEPQSGPLRVEDLATRRAAAGPFGLPHGAESTRKDRWAHGQGGSVAGEQDRGLAREQLGVVLSCPPKVEWQAAPPEAGRRRGAGAGGAEGLRQEKLRRIALLGLVSPRTDDVLAPAAPLPAARGDYGLVEGGSQAGAHVEPGDDSPYGLLGAILHDTPRKAIGRAGLDCAGGLGDHRLHGPTPEAEQGDDACGRMALGGGSAGASRGARGAGLDPVAEAQARRGCGRCGQGGCGCGECGGIGEDAEEGGGAAECGEGWAGADAMGPRGLDACRADRMAAGEDQDGAAACSRARGPDGPDMDWEAAVETVVRASGWVVQDSMRADAGLLPDAGLSGRITCLHLGEHLNSRAPHLA